jgi:CubicO group peptidase (beta-lactamase class C family)
MRFRRSNSLVHNWGMSQFNPVFDYLRKFVVSGALPGAVFGVCDAHNVLALDAFGKAPGGRAVTADDVYLLWSVTKPITGLAIMQLCEDGLVDPEADVRQILPWFGTNRTDKVQLWHLLTHTGGISESTLGPVVSKRDYLAAAGVSFHAGSFKQYSNQAFVAMEEILRTLTRTSLEAHLQARVFKPLGMRSTSFDTAETAPDSFMPMHGVERIFPDYPHFLKHKHPAAGLFSSATDMLRLGQCLLNQGRFKGGKIIAPSTLREMTRPQTTGIRSLIPDDWTAENEFALTFLRPIHSRSLIHKNMYGHNGWGGCRFWIYPDEGLCFVLMTNLMDADAHGVNLERTHNIFTSALDR